MTISTRVTHFYIAEKSKVQLNFVTLFAYKSWSFILKISLIYFNYCPKFSWQGAADAGPLCLKKGKKEKERKKGGKEKRKKEKKGGGKEEKKC